MLRSQIKALLTLESKGSADLDAISRSFEKIAATIVQVADNQALPEQSKSKQLEQLNLVSNLIATYGKATRPDNYASLLKGVVSGNRGALSTEDLKDFTGAVAAGIGIEKDAIVISKAFVEKSASVILSIKNNQGTNRNEYFAAFSGGLEQGLTSRQTKTENQTSTQSSWHAGNKKLKLPGHLIGTWESSCTYQGGGQYFIERLEFTNAKENFIRRRKLYRNKECVDAWLTSQTDFSVLLHEGLAGESGAELDLRSHFSWITAHDPLAGDALRRFCKLSNSKIRQGETTKVSGWDCGTVQYPQINQAYYDRIKLNEGKLYLSDSPFNQADQTRSRTFLPVAYAKVESSSSKGVHGKESNDKASNSKNKKDNSENSASSSKNDSNSNSAKGGKP